MSDFLNAFPPDKVIFIPLGGCQEFGINLNVYGYNGKWLVVDCGIGFTQDQKHPGLDALLPDPTFLEDHRDDILGILITHAHEDHVGAIPYLWSRLKCPVYCTPFTTSFLKRKCSEFEDVRDDITIREMKPDQILDLSPFKVKVVGVTHSTPTTVSFVIETPAGVIVHGNEWTLDPTPAVGPLTNREVFKSSGRQGVLAYIGDSTNAPYSGASLGEGVVQEGMTRVMKRAEGRVIVTMFASNVGRLVTLAKAARDCGRQVCVLGRSLFNYSAIARDHHMLSSIPPLLSSAEAAALPDHSVAYVVTGAQGEPRAVLSRIARGQHPDLTVHAGDTVIFSARAIPGNEAAITRLKSDLMAAGAVVIDHENTSETIHVTGHPYREEIMEMLDWVRPQIVVPIHGERFHLEAQADLARQKQVPHVHVPENGSVLTLAADGVAEIGRVQGGVLGVEPSRIVSMDHPALRERQQLPETGALFVSVVLSPKGDLKADIQISGMGLFDPDDPDDQVLIADMRAGLADRLKQLSKLSDRANHSAFVSEELRLCARRLVNTALGFKPKTSVHVVQI